MGECPEISVAGCSEAQVYGLSGGQKIQAIHKDQTFLCCYRRGMTTPNGRLPAAE